MHPFVTVMHLAGAVMLLLWAVRMVRTGVERAYGPALKSALRGARGGSLGIAMAGAVLAVVLQSATAVGILAAGFATSGILTVGTGIAALLGADVGSALVVKILSVDLSGLIPILMFVGATLFLKFEGRAVRQSGRIILGIAFILLSLKMVGEATEPLRESAILPQIIGYLQSDPLSAFALAAILAWLVHSSVATVLLFVTFAGMGMLPLAVALPMVLGANVGGGIIAVWLTRGMAVEARRIPLGNLIFRGAAAVLVFLVLQMAALPIDRLGATEGQQLVNFHLLFNLLLVLAALPFVGAMERLTCRLLPVRPEPQPLPGMGPRDSLLDRAMLAAPTLAIASVKRELLRMGETVEIMLRPAIDLLDGGSPAEIARVRALDLDVNRRHTDIKLFVAELRRRPLTEAEARQGVDLTDFAISLEHIGDLIAKTLLTLAEETAQKRLRFSPEGWAEISGLHARVQGNMQLALNILVSGDIGSARALAREKQEMRRLARESHSRHLARLQSGNAESIETSDIHLECVRALKEINSLLVTVAYPILIESGHLLESRLVQAAE